MYIISSVATSLHKKLVRWCVERKHCTHVQKCLQCYTRAKMLEYHKSMPMVYRSVNTALSNCLKEKQGKKKKTPFKNQLDLSLISVSLAIWWWRLVKATPFPCLYILCAQLLMCIYKLKTYMGSIKTRLQQLHRTNIACKWGPFTICPIRD